MPYYEVVLSDRELVIAWSSGDAGAGEKLFERHYEGITRFFHTKAPSHWGELTQRTFLACVEALPTYRKEGSFRAFLFGIAYRQLLRFYRERTRDERLDFGVSSVGDLDPSPSVVVAAQEEERHLLEALRHIPIEHQVILELHYWEEMTAKSCGEILGIPLGTAKTRLRRAKQLLEEQLSASIQSKEVLARTLSDLDGWARNLRQQRGPESSA